MRTQVPPFTSHHGIHAVDTQYVRPGLDASHIVTNGTRTAFVDTGPTSAVPHLMNALRERRIAPEQVELVLLTHIHLDHAGGAGVLLRSLPNARVVVHPRGARHLIDPGKLIAGSIAVYGREMFEKLYGEIAPIAQERVIVAEDGMLVSLGSRELQVVHTPGHALHHYCLVDRESNSIFSGDNFGISYRELDTSRGAFIYPTTTPVHFDPQAMHASLDRLMGFKPAAIYLTHYSRVTELERLAADMHNCIDGFVALARRHAQAADRSARIRSEMYDYLAQRMDDHGCPGDVAWRREMIGVDVELNSQGLEVWLDQS